jgi:hypothetical protein
LSDKHGSSPYRKLTPRKFKAQLPLSPGLKDVTEYVPHNFNVVTLVAAETAVGGNFNITVALTPGDRPNKGGGAESSDPSPRIVPATVI